MNMELFPISSVGEIINQFPTNREKRLEKAREYRRKYLENETEEQRLARLQRDREHKIKLKMKETPEAREIRLQRERERKQQRIMNETYEQRELRLQRDREHKRNKRNQMLNQDRETREAILKREREYRRKRLKSETQEQREKRLYRERIYKQKKRFFESLSEKHKTWLLQEGFISENEETQIKNVTINNFPRHQIDGIKTENSIDVSNNFLNNGSVNYTDSVNFTNIGIKIEDRTHFMDNNSS